MSDVVPPVAVAAFFVIYLGACFFASLSLVTSLIGDTFMKTHLDSKELKRQHMEEQRLLLSAALEDLLAHNSNEESFVSREGFAAMLAGNPVIFDRLRALGIRTDREELDGLFDHLSAESERQDAGLVRIDVLAEAMVSLRGDAKAGQLLDLKLILHSLRRETELQADVARKDADRNQGVIAAVLSEQQRKTDELCFAVATLQSTLASMQDDVSIRLSTLEAAVKENLHQRERREEQEKTEKRDAFAGVNDKLDTMTSKLAVQLQGLNAQIAQMEAKVESAVSDIAEVSTRLGGSSVATREGTLDVGVLENSGASFSGRGSISMWREDTDTTADCDPAAAATAAAAGAGEPTGDKAPAASAHAPADPGGAAAAREEGAAAPAGGSEVEPKLGS
ncbi:unnamed protein product [Prorocentrum cordatum]|uniref:Uncharacterized protein n=1 Tax=Prorocentrum cordatum TaxID=2364126 RepID=A0ABN9ST07_9DINO|nr:unnamed protein product [Polarella glacialis]